MKQKEDGRKNNGGHHAGGRKKIEENEKKVLVRLYIKKGIVDKYGGEEPYRELVYKAIGKIK